MKTIIKQFLFLQYLKTIIKKLSIIFLIFVFFLLFSNLSLYSQESKKVKILVNQNSEYLSIYDLVKKYSIDNSFDIVSQRGKLYFGEHTAIYQVGFSIILVDGVLVKSWYPIIRKRGEILFPLSIGEDLLKMFFPDSILKRKSGFIFTSKRINQGSIISKKNDDDRKKYGSPKKDRIGFIVIDPGHGGKDPGAIGRGKVQEKRITLLVSKYLKSILKRRIKNINVILTRSSDRFIELGKRTEIANRLLQNKKNGLLVSIHVNASVSKRISGFETYFLSQNPTNEDARTTAALENNVVVLEGRSKKSYDDVSHVEALMLTTQIQKESSMAAKSIQRSMDKAIWRFKSRGVKKADFFVLRGALMPAVLVELGYISNRKEMRYLKRSSYQKKIAQGIANGIVSFIKKYNKIIKNK